MSIASPEHVEQFILASIAFLGCLVPLMGIAVAALIMRSEQKANRRNLI